MLFHLLDVLAHDSKIESEDDATWHMCERKKSDGDKYTTRVKNNNYMGREFQIELFGVTETGSQVHVNVTGFCARNALQMSLLSLKRSSVSASLDILRTVSFQW